jgi:hypothetical protein
MKSTNNKHCIFSEKNPPRIFYLEMFFSENFQNQDVETNLHDLSDY